MMRPKKLLMFRLAAADKAGAESTAITEEHLPLQHFAKLFVAACYITQDTKSPRLF